ncbi:MULTISPECIES: radical SAM protein [unclassified Desulfovibrio]|uniref:radical SAM protein n=1 Tax=unclassified Desulfovibrio TaxID=2593640 RepID=UPI0013EA9F4E|nr:MULTISPECIES: radical SAM protein [unclassified Desulfovibrio]
MNDISPKYYMNNENMASGFPTEVNLDFFDYHPSTSNNRRQETLPELDWLHRFPFLERLALPALKRECALSSSSNQLMDPRTENIPLLHIPYFKHDALSNDKVILPLGHALPMEFPEGLQPSLPDYMYSALAVFHDDEWVFFDGDYASPEDFWNHFSKTFPTLSAEEKLFWGIIILKDKLPHPIGISRQISFHLGYLDQPLPQFLNLSLSSLCNIRCTICGAQDSFIAEGIKRRIINTEFLLKIADVFFPYLDTVEFNSFGEQLLYDDFPLLMALLNKYDCQFRLQTNGTTLPDQKLEAILSGKGMVTFSIDAMGEIFESQRIGAKWNIVEENVRRILSRRNPEKIKVGISPAITCKTLPAILDLCRWADDIGIDYVHLHYYDPIENGIEKRPSLAEQNNLCLMLKEYIDAEKPDLLIKLENQFLACGNPDSLPADFISPHKYTDSKLPQERSFYSRYKCILPLMTAQITPDEMVFPGCCQLYKRSFPCPKTDKEFFDLWFGKELTSLRDSLKFETPHPRMVPECQKCIAAHYRQNLKY